MRFDQGLGYSKPETTSAALMPARAIGTIEPLKDMGCVGGRDADAGIEDGELRPAGRADYTDGDLPTGGCIGQGILYEVKQHQQQSRQIAVNQCTLKCAGLQYQAAFVGQRE